MKQKNLGNGGPISADMSVLICSYFTLFLSNLFLPPSAICPAGWASFAGSCYWMTETVKNWHDAEAHCNSEQGHLASFHSQEELSFLTGELIHYGINTQSWVGLNDINVEGQFVYTDGTPADFLLWAPNQPDNYQNNEDCVHLRGMNHHEAGKLNDDFCTSTMEYICKKENRLMVILGKI
uniref:C-type lectin domain-containing protein n=1 Tax=Echeneis naucrates TaxID=173247 RepID=A0A665UEQ5_ECHNA